MSVDFVNRSIIFGSQMSLFWVPLSQAIVWGLTFATVLTLVCTPAMLALPHVLKKLFARRPKSVPPSVAHEADGASAMIRQFLDWYLGALESGGYPLIARFDGAREFDRAAAERGRDSAGGAPRLHQRQHDVDRHRHRRNGRVVGRRDGDVLGRPIARPTAADEIRTLRVAAPTEDRSRGSVVRPLRRAGRVHLAAVAGDPPSDRSAGRHRADALRLVFARDAGRVRRSGPPCCAGSALRRDRTRR